MIVPISSLTQVGSSPIDPTTTFYDADMEAVWRQNECQNLMLMKATYKAKMDVNGTVTTYEFTGSIVVGTSKDGTAMTSQNHLGVLPCPQFCLETTPSKTPVTLSAFKATKGLP
jgi:hypothetical protein